MKTTASGTSPKSAPAGWISIMASAWPASGERSPLAGNERGAELHDEHDRHADLPIAKPVPAFANAVQHREDRGNRPKQEARREHQNPDQEQDHDGRYSGNDCAKVEDVPRKWQGLRQSTRQRRHSWRWRNPLSANSAGRRPTSRSKAWTAEPMP